MNRVKIIVVGCVLALNAFAGGRVNVASGDSALDLTGSPDTAAIVMSPTRVICLDGPSVAAAAPSKIDAGVNNVTQFTGCNVQVYADSSGNLQLVPKSGQSVSFGAAPTFGKLVANSDAGDNGSLQVSGTATVGSTLAVTGATTLTGGVTGAMAATGAVSGTTGTFVGKITVGDVVSNFDAGGAGTGDYSGTLKVAGNAALASITDLTGLLAANAPFGLVADAGVQVGIGGLKTFASQLVSINTVPSVARQGYYNSSTRLVTRTTAAAPTDCAGGTLNLTVAQFLDNGIFTCATAQTVNFPTWQGAAGIVQNLPGPPAVGDVIEITGVATAANAITLGFGTGGTNGSGQSTVLASTTRHIKCRITAITGNSETATCY